MGIAHSPSLPLETKYSSCLNIQQRKIVREEGKAEGEREEVRLVEHASRKRLVHLRGCEGGNDGGRGDRVGAVRGGGQTCCLE